MTSVVRLRIRHPGAYFRKVSDWNVARRSWPEHRGSFQAVGACRERIPREKARPAYSGSRFAETRLFRPGSHLAEIVVPSETVTDRPWPVDIPCRPRSSFLDAGAAFLLCARASRPQSVAWPPPRRPGPWPARRGGREGPRGMTSGRGSPCRQGQLRPFALHLREDQVVLESVGLGPLGKGSPGRPSSGHRCLPPGR